MARSTAFDAHPEHKIEIRPYAGRVRVSWEGRTVVDTTRALELLEGRYPPVFYVPRADADASLLETSTHSTHCPFKGDASYLSLRAGDAHSADAIWLYEDPFDQVEAIRDHLAFYADRVTIEATADGAANG